MLAIAPLGLHAAAPQLTARATWHPADVRPGEYAVLQLTIDIPRNFYLYSPTRIPNGPVPLSLTATGMDAWHPEGPWHGPTPQVIWDEGFETFIEYHRGTAPFQRVFRAGSAPSPSAASPVPTLHIKGQICDDTTCHAQSLTLPLTMPREHPGTPRPDHAQPPVLSREPYPADRPPPTRATAFAAPESPLDRPETMSLWAFLLMAVIAGFGALLTPCVFPMVPITISYFSKYTHISTRRSLFMAALYTLTIVVVFALVGVFAALFFGATSMQTLATHPIFNAAMVLLLVFFALTLFGTVELRVPNALLQRLGQKEAALQSAPHGDLRRQALGVLLMAITFTLVSFTCTVGFVGWVLALAAQGETFYPLVGMMAFAAAFALPFFFLALFPNLAKRLQGRGGDWMLDVKIIFGILEIAAACKFLSNLDLHFSWGLLSRPVVLAAWTLLSLGAALSLLRLWPRRSRAPKGLAVHPARLFLAVLFAGIAAWTAQGATHERPMGSWVDGWLPPVPYPTSAAFEPDASLPTTSAHLSFIRDDIPFATAQAAQQNRPLFIDFTGHQCANCRWMETSMFTRPQVRTALEGMVRVAAITDGAGEVHRAQNRLKLERFQTAALPVYAIVNPHTDAVLATFIGATQSELDFVKFLERGQQAFHAQQQHPADP